MQAKVQIASKIRWNHDRFFLFEFRYLLDHGANVVACNSDGELPVDITDDDEMKGLLHMHMERLGKYSTCT